jgi:hypothetical protein
LASAHVGDESDAARIAFASRIVEKVLLVAHCRVASRVGRETEAISRRFS